LSEYLVSKHKEELKQRDVRRSERVNAFKTFLASIEESPSSLPTGAAEPKSSVSSFKQVDSLIQQYKLIQVLHRVGEFAFTEMYKSTLTELVSNYFALIYGLSFNRANNIISSLPNKNSYHMPSNLRSKYRKTLHEFILDWVQSLGISTKIPDADTNHTSSLSPDYFKSLAYPTSLMDEKQFEDFDRQVTAQFGGYVPTHPMLLTYWIAEAGMAEISSELASGDGMIGNHWLWNLACPPRLEKNAKSSVNENHISKKIKTNIVSILGSETKKVNLQNEKVLKYISYEVARLAPLRMDWPADWNECPSLPMHEYIAKNSVPMETVDEYMPHLS
jgi:hypothetical protein